MPKMYDSEFKARAVRMVRDHRADYPSVTAVCFAVAGQLGMSRETLRRWVTQAEVDDGAQPGGDDSRGRGDPPAQGREQAAAGGQRDPAGGLDFLRIFFAGELDSRTR
jgi:transposase